MEALEAISAAKKHQPQSFCRERTYTISATSAKITCPCQTCFTTEIMTTTWSSSAIGTVCRVTRRNASKSKVKDARLFSSPCPFLLFLSRPVIQKMLHRAVIFQNDENFLFVIIS